MEQILKINLTKPSKSEEKYILTSLMSMIVLLCGFGLYLFYTFPSLNLFSVWLLHGMIEAGRDLWKSLGPALCSKLSYFDARS